LYKLKQMLETWSGAKNSIQYKTYTQELTVKISAKNSKGCKHEKWLKQSRLRSNK